MRQTSATNLGDVFVTALVDGDTPRLAETLAPDVQMRALIPPGPIEVGCAVPVGVAPDPGPLGPSVGVAVEPRLLVQHLLGPPLVRDAVLLIAHEHALEIGHGRERGLPALERRQLLRRQVSKR